MAIEAHDLFRFFHAAEDETVALRGVSLRVNEGEFVAITGPSGSGKSTLLACLAGLDEPDGGWVRVGDERLTRRSEVQRARIRAERIGMLRQAGNLLDQFTVAGNVALARALAGHSDRSAVLRILESVEIAHRADAFPAQLSGGERARAGLAVALANDPDVLLADEPTGELDGAIEAQLLDLLIDRARSGQATVIVTHSPSVVRVAQRVIAMHDGGLTDA